MDNHELFTVFLEAQEPDYFQNMMSAMGRPFSEVIKIGEMVKNGLKTGRIVSQAALKATTQAIQNGSGSFANRKKRDEGNEIIEEVGETGDLTRSGRCYSPKELRKAKQIREGQLLIKKPVIEAEAEEFLKKIKAQDYSIIDQLIKTPAQISLLSLLIHSKEHARVLIKVLNEAHISEETTVNQLEKMANRFFEVNRISFTNDELPEEGAGHNRALNFMVKCEGHYIKRVMVNGGSSVDVCPISTLQSMKINTDRIRSSNVRIRSFDGSARDTMGEINLTMTIGPVDFEIVFQVVDMVTSYNFLLGRPWIHTARVVLSTLHQMLKFEHDGQEIIVHGENESSVYKDPLIPCIEAKEGSESIVYQAFEVVVMDHVEEGKPILHPRLSATSVMVATVMMRQGYERGKGLGESLQGISEPISSFGQGTFVLGFRLTQVDKNKSKHRKKNGWVSQQLIPHIFYTFVKPRLREGQNSSAHANIDENCHDLSEMFFEVNMIQDGEGTSRADVQLIEPDTMFTNWEATPFPTRKESCFVNAGFNNMTCMGNSCPDLEKLSNIKIMHQEVEYEEDDIVEEIKRELEQFENKPKPNLNETEPINIGSPEEVRETKISIHTEQKTRDVLIQLLFEYRDVFSWSYDDMPGLSADLVVHKLPTYPGFPPVQQKQ
ncbi:uncharacterized protein [Nicotiana sylvestris]|uniref:uncharacterized protein n=1 Tax=Nicotiana sylvestris TaxID=4096 RepID=UPI00388CCDCD